MKQEMGFTYNFDLPAFAAEHTDDETLISTMIDVAPEVPITITFDFYPGSSPVYYPNDKAHPGDPAEIEITSPEPVIAAGKIILAFLRKVSVDFIKQYEMTLYVLSERLIDHFTDYYSNQAIEKAFEIAADWRQERDAQEADYLYDQLKERRFLNE